MKRLKDYLQFSEPIVKMTVEESFSIDGCKLESFVINDKWKITPTNNTEKPFKKVRLREKISQNT